MAPRSVNCAGGVDPDSLPFAPMNAYPGSWSIHPTMTMVVGQLAMRDGSVLGIDERAPRAELRARQPEIDAAIVATAWQAARLESYWRTMYQGAAATVVGVTRCVGDGR